MGIFVLELGVCAKPSAKASVPNAVERSLSGPSVSKEESILARTEDGQAHAGYDLYLFGYGLHYTGH